MLIELNIKNFAIIDELSLSFDKGLNVLTGETGAGKSIIIDAVGLILGNRANKEYIKDKYTPLLPSNINRILDSFGIEVESDNILLISRVIQDSGRSISRINGRTVTLNMLKKITRKLVDIHGQHEHQSLLSSDKHIQFIDSLCGEGIVVIKEKVKNKYERLIELKDKLNKLSNGEMERERKLDLLKFQLNEIDEASLSVKEESNINEEYNILSNSEEILSTVNSILELMRDGEYTKSSIIDDLNKVLSLINDIMRYNKQLKTYKNIVQDVIYQLEDVSRELRIFSEDIEVDPNRLKYLNDRLKLVNRLKRKYGKNIEEILKYREEIASELEFIENSEEEIIRLQNEISKVKEVLDECYKELSNERKKISKKVEKDLVKELSELNMNNVRFKVSFNKIDGYGRNGNDEVKFLISTNMGEKLKSLSKIASGGEMSRIMLAFKKILADVDDIPSLIFDEIDSGISGRTAQVVGTKLCKVSESHQVLCVTHLPQIASMADNHYYISKKIVDNRESTSVIKLNNEERINELSRLLGGVNLTSTTKMHAKEMIEMSKKMKNK